MDAARSPVHDIVNSLWQALVALEAKVSARQVERWGFAIHAALSSAGREFHNHDHVIDLLSGAGPLESIAALYHDAVYIQVDHGPPKAMRTDLAGMFDIAVGTYGGWRLKPQAEEKAPQVLAIFGRKAGDVLTPHTGLNELASAIVSWLHLSNVLTPLQMITVVAAIEQTVPFREAPAQRLHQRLLAAFGQQYTVQQIDEIVQRAVRVGNLDVANFASSSPAEFLDNTWKLLPEANPSLAEPMVYSVVDYRVALHRMEEFLSHLDAAKVFHSWQEEPTPADLAKLHAQAKHNITVAVQYLQAKLFAVAFIEAIAELTGGDVPLDYFMGGVKSLLRPQFRRLETFFPPYVPPGEMSAVGQLLIQGRLTDSSFDIAPSPVAGYLYSTIGLQEMLRGFQIAADMWANRVRPKEFLRAFAPSASAIARAASNLLDTRKQELIALADELGAIEAD